MSIDAKFDVRFEFKVKIWIQPTHKKPNISFFFGIETRPFSFESVLEIAVGIIRISGVVDVAVIFVVVVVMVVEVVVRGNVEVVVKIGQLCSSDESSQSRFPSHLLCDSIHSLELTHRNCH